MISESTWKRALLCIPQGKGSHHSLSLDEREGGGGEGGREIDISYLNSVHNHTLRESIIILYQSVNLDVPGDLMY